jgi:hypothetical protein
MPVVLHNETADSNVLHHDITVASLNDFLRGESQIADSDVLHTEPYSSRSHQDHIAPAGFVSHEWFALVHTPVPMKEAFQIPAARKAVDDEWEKLGPRGRRAWVLESVQPKAKVIADAKKNGVTVHFANLMDLCHVKNSELPEAMRKFKGRLVLRGDNVKDEDGFYAAFSEQGTSASNLAAAKFLDAIARGQDCDGETSDAVGAYTQVVLDDFKDEGEIRHIETWISLPPSRRPKHWDNIEQPVCKLRLNLYGHPLAGLYWEDFCNKIMMANGFKKVPGWECLFVHYDKELFMSVYVDDFKLAGKKKNIAPMWEALGKKMDLEPAVKFHGNVYLGCTQRDASPTIEEVETKREFLRVLEENKPTTNSGTAMATTKMQYAPKADSDVQQKIGSHIKGYRYEMHGHAEQCVERYLELAKVPRTSLKQVAPPCLDDHQIPPEDFETKGTLAPVCARIVLKALYLARLGRGDLMNAVNTLAREVTKWTVAWDKRILRLISYISCTAQYGQQCWIGDKFEDAKIVFFSDASYADDLSHSKSTTGGWMCLIGPNTYVPICWICKRQTATCHSSTESEIIALETGTRTEAIPALMLWDIVLCPTLRTATSRFLDINAPMRCHSYKPRTIVDELMTVDFVH